MGYFDFVVAEDLYYRELQEVNLTVIPDGEINYAQAVLYAIQLSNVFFVLGILDRFPRVLACYFFACMCAGYPVSYLTNTNVYEFVVGDLKYSASVLKVVLVILGAGIPALWFYWSKLMKSVLFGRYITSVLVFNILYTLILDLNIGDACGYLRSTDVFLMCIALFFRLRLLEIKGQPVIYKTSKEPYSHVLYTPVSTLWVLAYVLWNSSYALAEFGPRTLVQIVLLIIGMGYEHLKYSVGGTDFRVFFLGFKLTKTYVDLTHERAVHDTPNAPPLGWFFGFARAITLSSYFSVNPLIGMIPIVQETKVSYPITCNTEVAFYNGFIVVLFVIDLFWAVAEFYDTYDNDALTPEERKEVEGIL